MTSTTRSFDEILASLQTIKTKNCHVCGKSFEAMGLVAVCESCENIQPVEKGPPKRELGDSWPNRHREKINAMEGPGIGKARQILPMVMAGSMVVLAGDRGRGKTQIATWLAWQRGQDGKPCGIYAKAFDLFSDVKGTWGKQSTDSESKIMDRYKHAVFLALDECHERGETDWENRTLRNVLDHRYDACLPTVIIGNWLKPDDVVASLGASISDRITETGGIVWCNWQSYRVS